MNRKIYFFLFLAVGGMWYQSFESEGKLSIESKSKSFSGEKISKVQRPALTVSEVSETTNNVSLAKQDDELSRYEQDLIDEMALGQLEQLKKIPGAEEMILDIASELERNPDLISYENLSGDEATILNDEYYEKLIPDSRFRKKWMKLMELIAESYQP